MNKVKLESWGTKPNWKIARSMRFYMLLFIHEFTKSLILSTVIKTPRGLQFYQDIINK